MADPSDAAAKKRKAPEGVDVPEAKVPATETYEKIFFWSRLLVKLMTLADRLSKEIQQILFLNRIVWWILTNLVCNSAFGWDKILKYF